MIPNTIFVKRVALALSLAASASSAPVEEAIMPAALNVRDPQNVTKAAGRDLPGNGADCTMYLDGELSGYGFTGFQLHMWGEWIQDGGQGFRDNINGECGYPVDWVWDWWDDGSAHVDFQVSRDHPNICVQNAVWDASQPTGAIWGMQCCWNTYPWCDTN